MRRISTLKSMLTGVALMAMCFFSIGVKAQAVPFELTTLNTPLVIDFNDFRAKGFTPAPLAGSGQLNSNNWYIWGMDDGVLHFGGTQTGNDFARDTTSGGTITSGGIYALNRGSGNYAMYLQPTGGDFTPGYITSRIQNNTGAALDSVKITYDLIVYNDQARGQVVYFQVGALDTIFQSLPTMTYITPETADNQFHVVPMSITVPTGGVPNGAYLYGRWITNDSLGTSGSRDEIGIDNITVTAYGKFPANQPCGDLFFSEYIEGSSSNKAVEIYNPTANPVNLSNYRVELYSNGATTATQVEVLSGTLAPGDVYVIANASANATILAKSDITSNITFFNGDDALALIKGASDTLDIIGTVGFDPGTNWPIGNPPTGSTLDNTLVRKPTVQMGEKNWLVAMNQWNVYPIDFTDSLGTHTMNPCGVVIPPTFNFSGAVMSVNEGAGTATVTVTISDPADCTIEVALDPSSTATVGSDFTFTSPQVLSFTTGGGLTKSFTIPIIDDNVPFETGETIVLNLQTPGGTGGCAIGATGKMTITFIDNDYPYYQISQIHGEDTSGIADSAGIIAELRGIVTFPDIRGTGLQFYIQDATGGINVFHSSKDFGYTVTLGDSIIVRGTIIQYMGLTEIELDTVILASTGNMMPEPVVTDSLYEALESHLVKIMGYTLVDPAQWTNSGSGFNVDVTNGMDTLQVRVDNDVDVFGTPAPTGYFDLVGVVSQFDGSSPLFGGYNILARSLADITAVVMPVASFTLTDNALQVTVINTSSNDPTTISWNFDDGTIVNNMDTVVHTYAAAGTYDICLTATNAAGSNQSCQSVTVQGVGIEEIANTVTIYPIPVTNTLTIETSVAIERVEVMDVTGKVVISVKNTTTKATIDMNDLSNGVYLVKIHTEKGIISKKVMKQ